MIFKKLKYVFYSWKNLHLPIQANHTHPSHFVQLLVNFFPNVPNSFNSLNDLLNVFEKQ